MSTTKHKVGNKTDPLTGFIAIVVAGICVVTFVVYAIKGLLVAPPWVVYFAAAYGCAVVLQIIAAILKVSR
jgi:hypothetical protein